MMTGQATRSPSTTTLLLPAQPPRAFATAWIAREDHVDGPLTDQERRRLVEIADRCPVHHTLSSEIAFETTEA